MSPTHSVLRRKLALLLASSWCAAALPGYAGAPIDPGQMPVAFPTNDLSSGGLFAAADLQGVEAAVETSEPVASAPAPSANVTMNLINRLVERGVLTKEDASDLIKQAEADALVARAQAEQTQAAAERAAAAAQAAMAHAAQGAEDVVPMGEDDMRVTYIPENVRAQMRDEIREEVVAQARAENWAAPRLFPDWVKRIKLFGDVRVRYEGIIYPEGNDNTGAFPNFNAINTGAPFDVSGTVFSPQLNVDQDRSRLRLRVRLGMEAQLSDGFTAGLRIATGENNSPVTTNQTLGATGSGQGGNFSKYAIWLDRGFLKYEVGPVPDKSLAITVGRFDNPFFSSEITWDDDLGFDGVAVQGRYEVFNGITPFFAGGAFPVFNTDLNFATNQPAKFASDDKWLYGVQIGTEVKIKKDFNFKVAAAYYYFENVEGQLSDPFTPLTAQDAGNTDTRRPSFAQKGNTYMALRNIVPNANNNFGTTQQFQYFGLATPFREVALTGRLDYNRWEPFQISLSGEWVKNLGFDRNSINSKAVNNRGSTTTDGSFGDFAGGDTAWIVGLKVGHATMDKRWAWQAGINYRNVESDAVVDGFTDSDFGLGGTNIKGYTLAGTVALSPKVFLGVRWLSANEVSGAPLKSDILQLDVSGKF